mgnify:CR=1 FL=1
MKKIIVLLIVTLFLFISGCINEDDKKDSFDENILIGNWGPIENNSYDDLPSENNESVGFLNLNSDGTGNLGGYTLTWEYKNSKLFLYLDEDSEELKFSVSYSESTGRLSLKDQENNNYLFVSQQ